MRQPQPAHLPREETVLASEISPGDGVNEVPEYVSAHFVVKRTVRPLYGCPGCDTVHSSALPAAIIDKGQADAGLLAQGVIGTMPDHLPLQRQQKIHAREGYNCR